MPHRFVDMLHLLPTSAAFGALFATGVVIDEKSMIPIGTLGGVCALVWWIGRKLQRIEDRLEVITEQAKRMDNAARMVEALPCVVTGDICVQQGPHSIKPLTMKKHD